MPTAADGGFGLFPRHAAGHVVVDLVFEMRPNLVIQRLRVVTTPQPPGLGSAEGPW